jgi:hypothetical protein
VQAICDLIHLCVWILQLLVVFGIPLFLGLLALQGIKMMMQREIFMGIAFVSLICLYCTFWNSFMESQEAMVADPSYLVPRDPVTDNPAPETWLDVHARVSFFATGMTMIIGIIFGVILSVIGGFVGGIGKAAGMVFGGGTGNNAIQMTEKDRVEDVIQLTEKDKAR